MTPARHTPDCTCRFASPKHALGILLVLGTLLVPATVCLAVISKVNVRNTGESTTASVNVSSSVGFSTVAGISECPVVVGSLVVNSGETAEIVVATQDGQPIEYSLSVTPQQEALLADKLEKTAIFNPAGQDLFSVKLFPAVCDVPTTNFEIEYKVFNQLGEIVIPRRLFAGGTTEADLNDGFPLSELAIIRGVHITGFEVPTVSTWGVAVMVLLLLVGARVYHSRRTRTT